MKYTMKKNKMLAMMWFVAAGVAIALLMPDASHAGGFFDGEGEMLFKTKCAACHAPDGSGSTAVGKKMALRDLRSAEVQKMNDQQLTGIVSKGKGKMPAFEKSLGADKVKLVIAYIRQLAKKK